MNDYTDRYLKSKGHKVQPNPEEGQPGAGRQGDRYVDGVKTEYKHPRPGADSATIKNEITSSIKDGGQARDFVIDSRGTGMSEAEARRGISRTMHPDVSRGKVDSIRVIGDGFDVSNK